MVIHLAFALLQVGNLDEARDWEFRAGRFETVGQVLSQELQIPVSVNESLKDEIVIGIFKDKTREEMVASFAAATLSRWTFENGGLTIRPDGKSREELEKKRIQAKIHRIKTSIDKVLNVAYSKEQLKKDIEGAVAACNKMSQDDEFDYSKIEQFENKSPSRRLVCEFLKNLNLENLAKTEVDSRLVYRMNPTRFQYPIGVHQSQLIALANTYLKDWKESLPEFSDDENARYNFSILQDVYADEAITGIEAEIDVAEYGYNVSVSFKADEFGFVLQGNMYIPFTEYVMEDVDESGSVKVESSPFDKFQSEFEVHPDDKLFLKVMQSFYQSSNKLTDEEKNSTLQLLSRFYSDEPLSRTATNMFVALSNETQKDVCGFVSDQVMLPYSETEGKKVKTSQLLKQLSAEAEPVFIEESQRFLLVEPILENGFGTMDRRVISNLASSCLNDGRLSFDELALAANLSKSKSTFDIARQFVMSLKFGETIGYESFDYENSVSTDSYNTMKLYANLPASDRAKLKSGKVRVPASSLGKSGSDTLLKTILRESNSLKVIDQNWETEEQTIRSNQILEELFNTIGSYESEPTFLMAHSVSNPVYLEFSLGSMVKFSGSRGGDFGENTGSIEEIAREAVLSEFARAQGQADEYYQPFQSYGTHGADTLRVDVYVGKFWKSSLQCELPSSPKVRYENLEALPKQIRDEYEKALAKYREEYKGITFGGEKKKIIPPLR